MSQLLKGFFSLGLIFQLGTATAATTSPLPYSMASLGDSITAGAIADYSLDSWKSPSESFSLIKKLLGSNRGKDMSQLERRDLSWSTGFDTHHVVQSHAARLSQLLSLRGEEWRLERYNGAISGDNSAGLLNVQVPKLLAWSHETLNQGAPDYVTILIGPNDICASKTEHMTPAPVFASHVRTSIEKILEANPASRILITEIPDIERVYPLAKDHRLSKIRGFETCERTWKKLGFCDTLLTVSNPAERQKIRERVIAYNAALAEITESVRATHGDQLRMAKGIYERQFELGNLSADCFHPNVKGQNLLSEATWNSSWWSEASSHFGAEIFL